MTRSTGALLLTLTFSVGLLSGQADPPPREDGKEDEKLLKAAGLRTDEPGLLKFFRDRTPSIKDRERLAGLIRQLGDRSYQVREKATRALTAAGENALELLRATLKAPPDEEVRRRAEQCLRSIEQIPHRARVIAAARLLALRRPEGAADALLAYLPFADWQIVGEDLLGLLTEVGLKGSGKNATPLPGVLAALSRKEDVCRAAAAHVLGHAAAEHRGPLAGLLTDRSPLVRYHAATALVAARDPRGVPVLVDLLANAPVELAWRAEDWLGRIAGEQSPLPVPIASDDPAARKRWRESWQAWWKANESKPDLARATQDGLAPGLTIVCEVDGVGKFPGRVCAFDRGGNLRWRVEGFDSPADVQLLRSGRILIAEFWTNRVTERDRSGQILWERKVNNHPVTAIRLRNGNTLIATSDEVFELDPNGKAIFNYKHTGSSIYCACKQRDGHVLFIDGSGKVSELNEAGKPVRTFVAERHASGASYWASIEPLPNGRYLMCLSGANMVVETDAAGKIHWECSVPAATYATRLGNGNTLVANSNGRVVVEVDRAGKEVWKQTTKGRPFRARRS